MNTPSERRKSIGSGGGSNVAGGKTRRYSIGVTSSRKSIGEEGNIVPNYLRASTGSCHDLCKHEHAKSALPLNFKRTTIVNKDKLPLGKKKPFNKPEIPTPAEPVKVTKKDVLVSSKKPQNSLINGKATKNEVKTFQRSVSVTKPSRVVVNREVSNAGIKQKDIKTVKKIGIVTPTTAGTVKKVVAKVGPNGSQAPKASFTRAASLKVNKSRGVKHVTPLDDQNRKQKTEPKQTIADKSEPEVKPETMEFDFMQTSSELVNPPVCNSSDSFSDKNVAEEELPIVHPVYESSELFSDKEVEVLEELLIVEKSKSCSDKEILEEEEEALIAPPESESSESFYDDEVLENESDYTDDEEAEASEEGSEAADVNEMETAVGNHNIPRKGKMVISEDKDEAVKLRFRRGKVLDLQAENNTPRRLKFRRRVIDGNEDGQYISRKTYKNKSLDLQNEEKQTQRESRRSFENKYVEETNEFKNGPETVVLKHQGEQEKKDAQGLLNNVIEETASKLVESRKSKVKALVGAFETVISLQDGKPSSG